MRKNVTKLGGWEWTWVSILFSQREINEISLSCSRPRETTLVTRNLRMVTPTSSSYHSYKFLYIAIFPSESRQDFNKTTCLGNIFNIFRIEIYRLRMALGESISAVSRTMEVSGWKAWCYKRVFRPRPRRSSTPRETSQKRHLLVRLHSPQESRVIPTWLPTGWC